MKCGFREFIGLGYEPTLNVYLEAEGDNSRGLKMPMPSMISNFLREVPSGGHRGNYATALRWVFNHGLYEAAKKRQELAKQASKLPVTLEDGTTGTLGQKISQAALRLTGFPRPARKTEDENGNVIDEYIPVYDHELFSKHAHEFLAQNGVPELKDFYDRTYGTNPDAYEPSDPTLKAATMLGMKRKGAGEKNAKGKISKGKSASMSSGIRIPMKELNDDLESRGKTPLRFGGYNGLIEYMEAGPWAPIRSPISPTEFDHGARHGYSLSKPTKYQDHRKDGSPTLFKFDDFTPHHDDRMYNQMVVKMMHNARAVMEDPELAYNDEDKADFQRMRNLKLKNHAYSGTVTKAAHTWEDPAGNNDFAALHNRTNRTHDYTGKPHEYAIISILARLGLEDKSANIPDMNYTIQDLFPGNLKIRSRYRPHKDVGDNEPQVDGLVNTGIKKLRQMVGNPPDQDKLAQVVNDAYNEGWLGPDPDMDVLWENLHDMIDYKDDNKIEVPAEAPAKKGDLMYKGSMVPYYDNTKETSPAEINALLDNGFQVIRTGPEKKAGLSAHEIPIRKPNKDGTSSFVIAYGDNVFKVVRDQDGSYIMINTTPEDQETHKLPDKYQSIPKPAMASGHPMRFNSIEPESTPYPKHRMNTVLDMMRDDPERFGFGHGEENYINQLQGLAPGKAMKKVKDLDDAINMAAASAKFRSQSNGIPDSAWDGDKNDVLSNAAEGLLRHSRDYKFYYGDLDSPYIRNYFAATGVTDKAEQDKAISDMKALQAKRLKFDDIDNQIDPRYRAAFAINGKYWRQPKMKQHIINVLRSKHGSESGSGDPGTDAEGNAKQDNTLDQQSSHPSQRVAGDGGGGGHYKRDDQGKIDNPMITPSQPIDTKGIIKGVRGKTPFYADRQSWINKQQDADHHRIEYYKGYNWARTRGIGNDHSSMKEDHFITFVKGTINQADGMDNDPFYKVGAYDGIGDAINDRIQAYIANPDQMPYPKNIVNTFIKPSGKFYLDKFVTGMDDKLSNMMNELPQAPEDEDGGESEKLFPTLSLQDPKTGAYISIEHPDELRHQYADANAKGNRYVADELRRQAIASGNKEYMSIVQGQQTGLPPVEAQPIPHHAAAAQAYEDPDWDDSGPADWDDAPPGAQHFQTSTSTRSPTPPTPTPSRPPAPQQPQPQSPQPPRPGGLAGRMKPKTPGAPWPGPNQNEGMESYLEFRLRQTRQTLIESNSSRA